MNWPYTWCEWTEWSVCSVEPCYPGPREIRRLKYPTVSHPPRDVAMREFCLNSTDIPITALHWPEIEGTFSPEPIKPMQMRSRKCDCTRKEFGLFGRLFGSCKKNDDQVECHTCFKADSTVYTHVADGGALLSCGQLADIRNAEVVANAAANSNRFYAILGGALGTAAFLVLVFCCVRFFLVSASSASSSSRRRSARRAAESAAAGGGIGQGLVYDDDPALRRSGVGLPYPHFLNSELPPSYKDVVAMAVVLPIDPGNPPTIQTDGTASGRLLPPTMPSLPNSVPQMQSPPPSMIPMSRASAPLEIGEKTTNDDDEASDDPPPPSYQEVIAFSPSAADMHQRIMGASAETAGSIQGAQERQSPSA